MYDPMNSGATSSLLRSIMVVQHSRSIYIWVLFFCFWVITTSALCLHFLPSYYRREQKTINISQSFQDCARLKKVSCWNILAGVIGASWNSEEKFLLWREIVTKYIASFFLLVLSSHHHTWYHLDSMLKSLPYIYIPVRDALSRCKYFVFWGTGPQS